MIIPKTISTELVKLIKTNKESDLDKSIDFFSDGLAKIIVNAIKSGTVTVSAGIGVQTVPATGTGSTVTPGTGTIS